MISAETIAQHGLTNEEYARQAPFGKRIAHGLLTLSISSGLMTQMNLVTDTVIAFYGIDKLRFVKPVFIGDTVHVCKKVADAMAKSTEMGVVTFETTVRNQNGEAVMSLLTDAAAAGVTVIMVTHSLAHAAVAQRTVKLLDGRVVSETLLAA